MEHRAGNGNFTLGPIGDRQKWSPEDADSAAVEGSTFIDLWLAENPASKDEAAQTGISSRKVAAAIPAENFFGPFAAEAKAISEGIKKYGSVEAFERATVNVDYFADSHLVEQWRPNTIGRVSVPAGGHFQSHLGSEGIHRTSIKKLDPTFVVDDQNLRVRGRRLDGTWKDVFVADVLKDSSAEVVPSPKVEQVAPSKKHRLSDDFSFE